MDPLHREIAAYEFVRERLEHDHHGRRVVSRDQTLVRDFTSYEDTITEAMSSLGQRPCLIRQIGAPPRSLPACAGVEQSHAGD